MRMGNTIGSSNFRGAVKAISEEWCASHSTQPRSARLRDENHSWMKIIIERLRDKTGREDFAERVR